VTSLFLCDQAVLSLYALGKTSGTVIDLGYDKVGAGAAGSAEGHYSGLPPPKQNTESSAPEGHVPERPACTRAGVPRLVSHAWPGVAVLLSCCTASKTCLRLSAAIAWLICWRFSWRHWACSSWKVHLEGRQRTHTNLRRRGLHGENDQSCCARPADIALVEEGRLHQPASRRLPYGGRELTAHLARLLRLGGAEGAALSRTELDALDSAKAGCMRVLDAKDDLAAAAAQACAWADFHSCSVRVHMMEMLCAVWLHESAEVAVVFIPWQAGLCEHRRAGARL